MRLEHAVGQAPLVFLHELVVQRVLNQETFHFLLGKHDRVVTHAVTLGLILIKLSQLGLVEVDVDFVGHLGLHFLGLSPSGVLLPLPFHQLTATW